MSHTEEELGLLEVTRHFGENGAIARLLRGGVPTRNDLCCLQ